MVAQTAWQKFEVKGEGAKAKATAGLVNGTTEKGSANGVRQQRYTLF